MFDYAGNAGTTENLAGFGMMGNGLDAPIVRRPDPTMKRIVQRPRYARQGHCGRHVENPIDRREMHERRSPWPGPSGRRCGYIDGWDWDNIRWGYIPPAPDWSAGDGHPLNVDPPTHSAFGSSHPGLFNAALCDGSVTAITYNVDLKIFKLASKRDDGEVYNADALR